MRNPIRPLVGIPANSGDTDGENFFHRVGEKYINAVINGAKCTPVLIPALNNLDDDDFFLDHLDGIFLTGAPSNVEPHLYGGTPSREGTAHDRKRDSCTLPLIRKSIVSGVPLFAVCRGIQELNVALGGTLHQNIHELPGKNDHRMQRNIPPEQRYDARHPISISQGGFLMEVSSGISEVMVNSLHAQAIDKPADSLTIEAVSDDGVIEAVSVKNADTFALGVQWHPEHPEALKWPLSRALFKAFGNAARARSDARVGAARKTSLIC